MREDFKENQATWSCAKENLECFVFEKKIIILFLKFPSFFFFKKYYLSFNIDFDTMNTALNNTREENI